MSVSLNPADVWKIFSEGKRRNRDEVAAWLDEVAADARRLADIWGDVARQMAQREMSLHDEIDIQMRIGGPNAAPFARLTRFYETASRVMRGRVTDETHRDFSRAVGSLVVNRNAAMRLCRTINCTLGGMKLLVDDASSAADMDEFGRIVSLLNREAAALEVLAKNFRASG